MAMLNNQRVTMHGINNLSTMINPINPLRSSQPSTFLTVGTSTEFYCSECFFPICVKLSSFYQLSLFFAVIIIISFYWMTIFVF